MNSASKLFVLTVLGVASYFVLFLVVAPNDGIPFVRLHFLPFLLTPEVFLNLWTGEPPQFSLADRLPVLGLAALILVVATLLGWLVLGGRRNAWGFDRLECLVFSAAVGLNLVSTYMLAIGWLGQLRQSIWLVAPGLAILLATGWTAWRRKVDPTTTDPSSDRSSRDARSPDLLLGPGWLVAVGPMLAILLLGAMLPPLDFDVREYHLQAPKEFFQQGRITFLPHNVYGNMPLGAEMHALAAMVLADDWWLGALAGKTVMAMFAPLTALGLVAAGRRFFSRSAGVVAAIVYLSAPWIVQVSTAGLIDGVLACYFFLAVYAAMLAMKTLESNAQEGSERVFVRYVALSGYLAGGAVACKYPAVLFVVVPLTVTMLVCGWLRGRGDTKAANPPSRSGSGARREGRTAARASNTSRPRRQWLGVSAAVGVFLVAVAAGGGGWLVKNWALSGNPTYPLLYSVFGGTSWTAEKDAQWNRVHRPHDFSLHTFGKDMARVVLTSPWLSPLVTPLAALALLRLARGPRREILFLAVLVAWVIATWWLLTHRIDRFWIPSLALASLLAGVGATWSDQLSWRRVLQGTLLFGLVIAWLMAASIGGYNRYFVPLAVLRNHPERVDAWHRYWNSQPLDSRLLLVGDAQPFDLAPPILYSTCFDDSPLEQIVKGHDAAAIRQGFRERNIGWLYVHWGEIDRYRRTYGFTDFVQPEVFDDLVRQGILDPLPAIKDHPGRGYHVLSKP